MKVSERFADDPEAFDVLLSEAAANADSDWEEDFTRDLKARYDKWGVDMFVSDKQIGILRRIADGDSR